MSGKAWVIFDGRAEYDTFAASVLEFAGTSKRQVRTALHYWQGQDGVLVEYDAKGDELLNERIIGHLREGSKSLLARCTSTSIGKADG